MGVTFPLEDLSEREMLNNGKFRQDLGDIHLDHSL